jgi:hypothetical protein
MTPLARKETGELLGAAFHLAVGEGICAAYQREVLGMEVGPALEQLV